jgi:3-hydroxy-9,10-secoandrosta-1,3,5(10)-triene-9,17-dione monooxygenase reductase component
MTDTAIETAEFRTVLGHFASGVVVVTGMHRTEPCGLTCQSFFSLSLDPPLVAFAPGKSSTSWPKVSSSGHLCVNVLASEQESLARTFAQSGADKFDGVGYLLGSGGAPRIHDALAWIDCAIVEVLDAGDHYLAICRVAALELGSDTPLLFYRGGFGTFVP